MKNIVVVEDEVIIAKNIELSLEKLGYNVAGIYFSGEELLQNIKNMNIDVILMDISLQGDLTGVETARIINTEYNIPVVFITGYDDEQTLNSAKKVNSVGCILKPFDEKGLSIAIETGILKHKADIEARNISKKQTENFYIVLKSITDGVIAVNTVREIILLNKAAEKLFGVSEKDMLEKDINLLFKNETDNFNINDIINLTISDYKNIDNLSNLLSLKKGTKVIYLDVSTAPLIDNEDNVMGAVIALRDITEKIKMEEELIKNTKLESLGLLAGGLAHDFNNYLTAILGNITLAKLFTNKSDAVYEVLSDAENACIKSRELTYQLLTFSKGGLPVKEVASVGDLLLEAVPFLLKDSNVSADFDIDESLNNVMMDKGQITQVINNIVLNALQSMSDTGTINIIVRNIAFFSRHYNDLSPGEYVEIEIRDTGTGIKKENLDKIFDPYFTTKRDSIGLGLAVSYSIIKKHDGTIKVTSDSGKGTSFYIYLPVFKEDVKEKKEKIILSTKQSLKGRRILVMDDNRNILSTLRRMLEHLECEVATAINGNEAIDLYKKSVDNNEPYDIVILDLTIPGGMGGQEVCSNILKINRSALVVVSSGYSTSAVMSDYKKYGFRDVIGKPYKIDDLYSTLFRVLKNDKE